MTEYELLSFFNEVVSDSELLIDRFLTLLFGFLIASYLVSTKLDRLMTAILLSLYTVMAIRYAFVFFHLSSDVILLADELRAVAANSDSSMNSWLNIGPVHIFFPAVVAVMLLSYVASIVFFFRARTYKSGLRFDVQEIVDRVRD